MGDYFVRMKVTSTSASDVRERLRAAFGATALKESSVTSSSELPNYFEACKANDHFGCVHWTEEDLASKLRELNIPPTPEIIDDVQSSYAVRHIEDRMIERGWEAIEEAIAEARAG